MSSGRLKVLAVVLLVVMAVLMSGALRQESATVDETTSLAAGWALWKNQGVRMVVDHPPLLQLLSSAPLLFTDVKLSDEGRALLEGRTGYPWTRPWSGPPLSMQEAFPEGRNWYHWAAPESQLFGQALVFGSGNDGERMLFLGRLVMVALALLTGVVAWSWAQRLGGAEAGTLAVAMWALNTVALAYGHLILTDAAVTLMMPLAVWRFGEYLLQPNRRQAVLAGLATAGALLVKFSSVLLLPTYAALLVVFWIKQPEGRKGLRQFWRNLPFFALAGYALVLLLYAPHWEPPPPWPAARADRLGVPGWFQALRPVLIPGAFFKGLALAVGHASGGHEAFLCGEWRQTGWWYYFPVALALKTPLPLLALMATGIVLLVARRRELTFAQAVPWIVAGIYLFFAMISSINIGIRHLFPLYPLLAVGVADQVARASRTWRIRAWVMCACMAVVALVAYPLYVQCFSLLVGGPDNGYNYLIDSNYDWGQDAKRLKQYLQEQGIQHIYLDYFGTQMEINYLKIRNTRVSAESARQIPNGILVVSASQLMRPEWAWLRESHPTVTRVAHTLFVYRLP